MRKRLLLSLALLCVVSVWAAQRSSEEAFRVACSFFEKYATTRAVGDVRLVAVSGDLLKYASTRGLSGEPSFYVYNQGQSAYVIVSGDDRMKPVLGYSDCGAFVTGNLPSNIQSWLESYHAVYVALNAGEQVVKEPRLLMRTAFPDMVEPLLKDINWNQDAPYNNSCPLDKGQRSMTGCVATAMAMMLKYYNFPVKGKGTHSYKLASGIECSFDYGNTTFSWDKMLSRYVNGSYTAEQAASVAELMYACGVAVDMTYSSVGSGAYSYKVGQALIDYFGYDENMGYVYREYFTSEEWMNMIKTELSEGRPIFYNGVSKDVGHAFVFDGYDARDMVHVNWGWGGANNGYFEVSSLNPSSPGIGGGTNLGGGFVYQQGMIIGMRPPVETSMFVSHFMLGGLKFSQNKLVKGVPFDMTITGLFNMSVTFRGGELGLIAEKDGKQVELMTASLPELISHRGYANAPIQGVKIPDDLADGTYMLYLATKETREAAWSRARGTYGAETQFTLTVAGSECTLALFEGGLNVHEDLDGSIEILHNLYSGRKADFKVLLSNKNTAHEFYGTAGVLFIAEEKGELEIKSMVGDVQLELKPGTTDREISISGDLISTLTDTKAELPSGDYYICPGVMWGQYIYSIGEGVIPVKVNRAFGVSNLVVKNARLEEDRIEVGDKLKLLADLSLSGIGNVYDETLMAAIFVAGQNSTNNLHYAEVFIEKGRTCDFEMLIDPQIGEGSYNISLYKPEQQGGYDGNKPLCDLQFSVGPFTGIDNERADGDRVRVYQQPAEGVLYIRTDGDIKVVTLYNLSGQQVICLQDPANSDGKEYSVPVAGLASGCYIVAVQLVDGTICHSKFIKR